MNNELNQKNNENNEQLKNFIKDILCKIKKDYDNNFIIPLNIYELNKSLNEIKMNNNKTLNTIIDLLTIEYLFFFRILLINEKSMRIIVIQILKNCIEINPTFTNKILDAMIPIIICKILEDKNSYLFEERYLCLKFIFTWLKISDYNFPIIFAQAIASIAKTDDTIKIGCLEFLREMSILRTDLCNLVGGFRIIIHSMQEDELPKRFLDKLIFTFRYIVSTPNKRRYFNSIGDFYKYFSAFTKSDFALENNIENDLKNQTEETKEESKKLEKKLNTYIYILKKVLISWPGYFLIMNDKFKLASLSQSLNNNVNIIRKKAILKLFKEILEYGYNIIDNFNYFYSEDKDILYVNKIYIAYIIQGFYDNNLNKYLLKFIEKEENIELKKYALKLAIKYNILFVKLSNNDLQTPYLSQKIEKIKWFEKVKDNNNINKEGENVKNIFNLFNYLPEPEKQKSRIRIDIMHLLDKIFHHINCKDTPSLNIKTISTELIIAIHNTLNMESIKKYENQYSIESCKKELYSKEDFPKILKQSKILELKDFNSWDWTQIDSLLDLIEIKTEIISELNKLKFFKKLLLSYSPSKNLIVKKSWTSNNFYFSSIGKKLFKLLSSQEDLSILDTPNEDYIFQKSNSWLKDVIKCLNSLFDKNIPEDHPFSLKRIYNTLSRDIFTFIGIISNSIKGNEYLESFYSLLDKFIVQSNKYDYLLTLIIDNLNFNSKYVFNWVQNIMERNNNKIKKYILNHIHCLLILGKETLINIKMFFKILNPDYPDTNKVIISIIKFLINKGKDISHIFKDQSIIEKVSQVDKSLLYILMRDPNIYDYFIDIINKEIDNINIDKILDNYGNEMHKSMIESFEIIEEDKNKYYLTINLSETDNFYHHYYEYFWIKQLPFNILFQTIGKKEKRTEYFLINYMEYNENDHNITIVSQVQEPQKIFFDETLSGIQIICLLGKITINRNCKEINNASIFLSFSIDEILKDLIPYDISKNNFLFQKDGIKLILKQNNNQKSYTFEKLLFNIRIRPDIVVGFKTPINLITELNNNSKGFKLLEKIKAVKKLFSYFENIDEKTLDQNSKKIKSALWILIKLTLKNTQGKIIQNKYNIFQRISKLYYECNDFSIKGTIIYLTSYAALNKELKSTLKSYHVSFFFNTNICYPSEKWVLFNEKKISCENDQLNKDFNIINSKIKLGLISEQIYDNVTNLLNNITFRLSIINLDEIYKINYKYFLNVNLFIRIYAVLAKYKLKESARRAIMVYFEKCMFLIKLRQNKLQ